MARIDVSKMNRLEKQRNTVHDEVSATYTVFVKDNKRYFQIDTYRRAERDIPEKISQSIQLDEGSVSALIDLLNDIRGAKLTRY